MASVAQLSTNNVAARRQMFGKFGALLVDWEQMFSRGLFGTPSRLKWINWSVPFGCLSANDSLIELG